MGGNMARRLARGGARVTGFDRDAQARTALADTIASASSLRELVGALPAPRVVWLMLPAGDVTEAAIDELGTCLAPGDLVVDGGNANYRGSQRRGALLAA